ncbi:MAG: triose-phosphate isomerase [Bacteroidota bacterium]
MKNYLIAGNWKMNTTPDEARELAIELSGRINANKEITGSKKVEILVCPPFINIPAVSEIFKSSTVMVGAQNCHSEEKGAFTGEISAMMLKMAGASHIIVGHSERRAIFKETDSDVAKKVTQVLKHQLIPILCVGETEAEREADETEEVIGRQLRAVLKNLGALAVSPSIKAESDFKNAKLSDFTLSKTLVIAYEPVWAIGTGKSATPEMAQKVHAFIRSVLKETFGSKATDILILYGGSVTAENAAELLKEKDINGALVGGASLKAEGFVKIIEAAALA